MALLTATLAYGGQWEIADLPFAIPFPRHPQLVGDARIAWQPHIVFPGYEYPLKPGTSSEYPSELDNFKAIAEQGSTASPMFSSQVTLTEEQLFAYGFQLETSPPPDHHLPADLEPESLSDNDPSDADSQAFETRTDLEQPDSNPDQALKIDVNILNLDKDEAHDASSASSKSDLDRSPMTIAHNDANRSPGDTSHPHTATGDETTPQADAACEQTNPHTCECGRSIPISPTATKADGQKRPPLSPSPPTAGESRPNPAPTPTPGTSATTFDDFDCYLTESLPAISAGGPAAPEQSASIQQVNWDLPEETNADATAPRSKTAADPPPTSAKPRSESGLFERQHSSLRQSSTARVVSNQPSPFDSRRSGFSKPLSSDGRHSFTARQQFAADGSLLSYPHQKPGSSHGAPIDLEMSADEKRFFEYQTDGPYPNQSQRMAAHRANRYMSEAGVLTSDPNMVVRYRVPAGLHDGSPVLVVAVPYTEVQRRRHQRTSTLASGEIRDKTILTAPMGILVDNAQVVPKVEADAPVDSDADGSGPESSVESHIVNDRHRPKQISRSDRFASHANQPALSKASSFSQLDVIEKQSRTQELMYATPQVGSPTKKSVSKFQKVLSRLSLLKKSKQEKSDKESGSGSAASLSRQQRY